MISKFTCIVVLSALTATSAFGQAKSLDKCEKAAAKQAAGFISARNKAIQKCLQKISGEVIKSNEVSVAGAAKSCASSFRKLVNSAAPAKTVAAKAKAKIRKACDPTVSMALTHTTNQVLSLTPAGVTEGIKAKKIESYCQAFSGDGNFDTVEEWVDCTLGGGTCESNQSISVQYPRALEWLGLIKTAIQALPSDPKYTDAVTAIDEVRLALDSNSDMALDISCGPGDALCGNGTIDANEECDGVNLNGQTCVSVGFPDGGTLSCQGNCGFNYQGCTSGTFSQTGQTTTFDTGDDGALQAGPPFSYVDNGDGTITDQNSGLTWEKLSDDGSIHDQNNGYSWHDAFDVKIAGLNSAVFAGHSDWRVPNRHELASILDLGATNPAIHPIFNTGCALNCTVTTCSCTTSTPFWTSTTRHAVASNAWYFVFLDGSSERTSKASGFQVRAVRGP